MLLGTDSLQVALGKDPRCSLRREVIVNDAGSKLQLIDGELSVPLNTGEGVFFCFSF